MILFMIDLELIAVKRNSGLKVFGIMIFLGRSSTASDDYARAANSRFKVLLKFSGGE